MTDANAGRNHSQIGVVDEGAGDDSSSMEDTANAVRLDVATNRPKREPRDSPKRKGEKWTKEEEHALLVLFLQGMEFREIGIRLGRSDLAIAKRFMVQSPIIARLFDHQATEIKNLKAERDAQAVLIGRLVNGWGSGLLKSV